MKFLTRNAVSHRGKQGQKRWADPWPAYLRHLKSIKPRLTAGWQELAQIDFHDTEVHKVDRPSTGELVLSVAMNSSASALCTVQFTGVRQWSIPESILHSRWLYSEVHLAATGPGGEFYALFTEDELAVSSEDVTISKNYSRTDWYDRLTVD